MTFAIGYIRDIAQSLVQDLQDYCDRIEIVGSIRRARAAVNDIDLIAIPKFQWERDDTLFGQPVRNNLLEAKLSQLCLLEELHLITNGPKFKRFHKIIDDDRIPIDIYTASPETWWTLLLVRTGSQRHNIQLARRAIELHMQLKADGSGLVTPGGDIIPIESEKDIYRHLKLPYRRPEERE